MTADPVETLEAARPKVFLEDLGCQMNRIDSEIVLGRMRKVGFERVETAAEADVVLYYGCAVREHAEDKVFGRLGTLKRLKAKNPNLLIGVMGCMAQNQKERIFERAPHVDLVVGTSRFEDIVDLLEEAREGERVLALDRKDLSFERDLSVRPRRHTAFVTAMRGCNKFCTFCVVPYTQGRERSRPIDDLLDEARRLVDDGAVELTLLGQRIDTYGLDLKDGTTLAQLLARLHEEVPGLLRIGFITSHPNHMSDDLGRAVADHPRVSRYLHLPVQSGSDAMLRAMNRGYDVDRYRRAVAMMREHVPEISLATDWIVGFPGETEADFEASVALLREMDYQGSFIFKYSPRTGTRAFEAGDTVPREVKESRNQVLLEVQREVSLARNLRRIGDEVSVLVEGPSKLDAARWTGRTDQNLIVHFSAERDFTGRLARVRLREASALAFQADLI